MICQCSLAGTIACRTCRHAYQPMLFQENIAYTKTKIIEKYEDGKLVERIIEPI